MKAHLFLCGLLALYAVACSSNTGTIGADCNPDGTCNSANLECVSLSVGNGCRMKPPKFEGRCRYESECFILACYERCGEAGVEVCSFVDTTTWGNNTPATCKCK